MQFPKVLVTAPQHISKRYCWVQWADRVNNLTYPNYDVFLAENSEEDDFYEEIKDYGFKAKRVGYTLNSVLERTTKAHEECRLFAIKGNYDYILHLETDVIPPFDVIEQLLSHNQKVVSGVYDIFHGKSRKAMIQIKEPLDRSITSYRVVPFLEQEEPLFFNGMLKNVYHAGIGCILIRRDVFMDIPFRYVKGESFHADTWFANDCFQRDIPIYVDTLVTCQHLNNTWLDVADEILNNK